MIKNWHWYLWIFPVFSSFSRSASSYTNASMKIWKILGTVQKKRFSNNQNCSQIVIFEHRLSFVPFSHWAKRHPLITVNLSTLRFFNGSSNQLLNSANHRFEAAGQLKQKGLVIILFVDIIRHRKGLRRPVEKFGKVLRAQSVDDFQKFFLRPIQRHATPLK